MKKLGIIFSILIMVGLLVGSTGVFAQEDPITHTIMVGNNFFSEEYIEVEIGDTVEFVWENDAVGHNVVQTEGENSIQPLEEGFSSGGPRNAPFTYVIPDEYLSQDDTLYVMCQPHAASGMIIEIKVGTGIATTTEEASIPVFAWLGLLVPVVIARKK